MKKTLLSLCCLLLTSLTFAAEDAQTIIAGVNKKFGAVNNYTADAYMEFNIPGVKVRDLNGKAYYKKPNLFRIKADGIFFLPKQNMAQQMNALLADTRSYTAVLSGYEDIRSVRCAVINVIPLKTDGELLIARLWIDPGRSLILRSQITTKTNGTVETFSTFDKNSTTGLPSRIEVHVETARFKVPKMLAADINKKAAVPSQTPAPQQSTIVIRFSNYKINTRFDDKVFTDE